MRHPSLTDCYGLGLSGGGARGAYQIGCWRAFREVGLKFQAVAGSSVGALNGAFICQGDYARAEHFWSHVSPEQILHLNPQNLGWLAGRAALDIALLALPLPFKTTRSLRFFRYATAALAVLCKKGTVRQLLAHGLFDADTLERTIERYLDLDRLSGNGTSLIVCTLQCSRSDSLPWPRIRYHEIDGMEAHEVKKLLLASASIPLLFPAVKLDGAYHRDGALLARAPLRPLYQRGIRKIVTVHLKPRTYTPHRRYPDASIITIAPRELLARPPLGMLKFAPHISRMHLEMGYRDAMETLWRYGLA